MLLLDETSIPWDPSRTQGTIKSMENTDFNKARILLSVSNFYCSYGPHKCASTVEEAFWKAFRQAFPSPEWPQIKSLNCSDYVIDLHDNIMRELCIASGNSTESLNQMMLSSVIKENANLSPRKQINMKARAGQKL